MCKEEMNGIEELEEQEYISNSEEAMGQIAVDEELKRIEIQNNPTSKVSEYTKKEMFENGITIADTVGYMFQKLIGYGVDYNNALAIASGYIQNCATLDLIKAQVDIQKDNQI